MTNTLENQIINENCLNILPKIKSNSVHLILSDIPYGIGVDDWDVLHDNTNSAFLGTSPAQRKAGAIFKKRGKPLNGWSEADKNISKQYYDWCGSWVKEWLRILKPGGSAIVFAGRRLAHRCISSFEDIGFTYKDMICWHKEKAPHRAQRVSVIFDKRNDIYNSEKFQGWRVGNLRPVFEPILWFVKPYKIGGTIADNMIENEVGSYNESAFLKYVSAPNNIIQISSTTQDTGLHPTQKPLKLMQALIELTTSKQQVVVDPFMGSGTTIIAAASLERKYIGIELNKEYYDTTVNRLTRFNKLKNDDLFKTVNI
ncbi:MAG: site-specific DNA-methyltransferase [Endomicrobiaceae bacterium]